MSGWTSNRTYAPPRTIVVRYVDQQGQQRSVSLTSTDVSETSIGYSTFTYINDEGATDSVDVAVLKTEIKVTTQASINGALVAGKLASGQPLPSGNATTRIETSYEYVSSTSGPVLAREVMTTMMTLSELAGGLAVPSYEYYTPGTSQFVSIQRIAEYSTVILSGGGEATRSAISTWIAYGLTQEGQQSFNEQMKQLQSFALDPSDGRQYISNAVLSMTGLVFQGTELRVERGRIPIPSKPSDQSIARDTINAGQGDRKTATGTANYGSNNGTTKTRDYDMPFAPDDFFEWVT